MNKLISSFQGRPIVAQQAGITVTRVGAYLGAEITGIDLRKPMSDEQRDAIENALAENELLIFRNQDINSQNLIDLGSRFGELTVHPFAPTDKDVSVLIKFRNDETNPPFRTDVWHSDETFRKEPPKATILVAKEVPAIGGDTMFAEHVGGLRRAERPHAAVHLRPRSAPRLQAVPRAVRRFRRATGRT